MCYSGSYLTGSLFLGQTTGDDWWVDGRGEGSGGHQARKRLVRKGVGRKGPISYSMTGFFKSPSFPFDVVSVVACSWGSGVCMCVFVC